MPQMALATLQTRIEHNWLSIKKVFIMRLFFTAWVMVLIVMLPIDYVWLKSMRWFYEQQMGDALLSQPRLWIALIFYLVLASAIAFFAVIPNLDRNEWIWTALYGAFLGLAAYGTYDATNHATLKNFPLAITVVDWAWGTLLCATSAAVARQLMLAVHTL
jgi:uncharacterized membrane protein